MAKNKVGRPKADINIDDFVKLCELQCTRKEICSFFDCSDDALDRFIKDTFNEPFTAVFERFRGNGLLSLRRSQFQLAERNTAMAIWLGKQYLGQKDIMTFNSLDDGDEDALTKSIKASLGEQNKPDDDNEPK